MKIIVSSVLSRTRYRDYVGSRDSRMGFADGFRRLGHEVYVFEDVAGSDCVDAEGRTVPFHRWDGRRTFRDVTGAYGFADACCLIYEGGRDTWGMDWAACREAARGADLLLAVGGRFRTPEILDAVGHRAYVDINPGKTQVYAFEYDVDYGLDAFDSHFSVGLAVGAPGCPLPTGGLRWRPLMWPVVMERWTRGAPAGDAFSTLSSWGRKHEFSFQGTDSGDKVEQWLRFLDLPGRTDQRMEIGLPADTVESDDLDRLRDHGWSVRDSGRLRSLDDYVGWVAGSRAEFSVANGRYVKFRTGWFSDRTSRFLAAGRPVLVQSTGIEDHLPVGEGLLTFETMDEAADGIERINRDYDVHSEAARDFAREHSASGRVLGGMLREVALA